MKKSILLLAAVLGIATGVMAGDTFTGGYTFTGETGLHTGAQLDDLVERARFSSGAFDGTTNGLFTPLYFTNDASLRLTIKGDSLTGALIQDGTVDTDDLADGSVTLAKLDSGVSNALASTPYCMGVLSSNQVVDAAVWSKIGYDIERIDEGGMLNPSNGIITIPAGKGGDYMFNMGWVMDSSGGIESGALYTNGNIYAVIAEVGSGDGLNVHETYGPLSCTAGMELAVYVSSGSAANVVRGSDSTNSVYFGAWRLSK